MTNKETTTYLLTYLQIGSTIVNFNLTMQYYTVQWIQ